MPVGLPVMDVEHTDDLAARHQRHREERLVGVLHQRGESFEPAVREGSGWQRNNGLVLGHPAGDSFADVETERADLGRVRELRGAQHDFVILRVKQVHQAGVRRRHQCGQADQVVQHFVQSAAGAHNPADTVQHVQMRSIESHQILA